MRCVVYVYCLQLYIAHSNWFECFNVMLFDSIVPIFSQLQFFLADASNQIKKHGKH